MRSRILYSSSLSVCMAESWVLDMNLCSKIKDEKDFVGVDAILSGSWQEIWSASNNQARHCQKVRKKEMLKKIARDQARHYILKEPIPENARSQKHRKL